MVFLNRFPFRFLLLTAAVFVSCLWPEMIWAEEETQGFPTLSKTGTLAESLASSMAKNSTDDSTDDSIGNSTENSKENSTANSSGRPSFRNPSFKNPDWNPSGNDSLTAITPQNETGQKQEIRPNSRVPQRFRRVYVPQEMLSAIPTHGEAYWPISAAEFENWAATNELAASESGQKRSPFFAEQAVYCAKLTENQFLAGSADLRIRKIPLQAGRLPEASFTEKEHLEERECWAFQTVGFALESALNLRSCTEKEWLRRDVHFHPEGFGEVEFHPEDFRKEPVQEAEFQWSQRASSSENGVLVFELAWLPAANTQWLLALPAQWVPETAQGLVRLETIPSQTPNQKYADFCEKDDSIPLKSGLKSVLSDLGNGNWKLWRIAFGGQKKARLTLRSMEAPTLQNASMAVSQKSIYQIRKEGMDVFVRMSLDSLGENAKIPTLPVRELFVKLEGNLVPVSVRFNETDVTWNYVSQMLPTQPESPKTPDGSTPKSVNEISNSAPDSQEKKREVFLRILLPKSLQGVGNRLEINAVGNLEEWLTESVSSLHPLPRIRLQQAIQSEALTQVQVFSPLEVADFSLQNASLLANHQTSGMTHLQMEFQEFSETALLELALTRLTTRLGADMTTAIDFQEHEISAVTELLVSVNGGECFEILGVVDRAWMIDAVESAETGAVEDWNLDVSPGNVHQALSDLDPTGALPGKLSASGWNVDSLGILRIQLAHSIRPGHPVSLRIRARRLGYSNNFTFTGMELAPLCLPTCEMGQSWLLCASSGTWKVNFLDPYREQDVYWSDLAVDSAHQKTFDRTGAVTPFRQTGTQTSGVSSDQTNGQTNSQMRIPQTENANSDESFIGFPTMREARKQFPPQMTFLTGIQDFKNVPMLRLEYAAKTFTAEVRGFYDITSNPNAIYRISCTPQDSEVERLRIVIRPGVLLGTTWKFPRSLSGSSAVCVERRKAERLEETNSSFELWEITFPQPIREPFEFEVVLLTAQTLTNSVSSADGRQNEAEKNRLAEGTQMPGDYAQLTPNAQLEWWRNHFPNGLNLPLLDVPDASECRGTITLQNDVTDCVLVETQEMIPAIISFDEIVSFFPKNASEDCCCFRFKPHSISNSPAPFLKLRWRPQNLSIPNAWIWQESCQSQFFANGRILHSAAFKIENIDSRQIRLAIANPSGEKMDFLGVIVNGQRISVESVLQPFAGKKNGVSEKSTTHFEKKFDSGFSAFSTPQNYQLRIPFPVWQRQNEIIVQWMETTPKWQISATLAPPKITADLRVLQSSWKAWIPENFVPIRQFSVDENWKRETKNVPQDSGNSVKERAETEIAGDSGLRKVPSGKLKIVKDSPFLRLFGTLRLGKNVFSRPENLVPSEIESPIELDSNSIRRMSFGLFEEESERKPLSHIVIFSQDQAPHSIVGWNCCFQEENQPIFVIYGNVLEAVRWFLLLFTCFLMSWLFAPWRFFRIALCGAAASCCMVVPLVWTPVFSGIFLGVAASFIDSSIRRHLRYASENCKPIILVQADARLEESTKGKRIAPKTFSESHFAKNLTSTEKKEVPEAPEVPEESEIEQDLPPQSPQAPSASVLETRTSRTDLPEEKISRKSSRKKPDEEISEEECEK